MAAGTHPLGLQGNWVDIMVRKKMSSKAKILAKANYRDRKKISGCQWSREWGERPDWVKHRAFFRAVKLLYRFTVIVDT